MFLIARMFCDVQNAWKISTFTVTAFTRSPSSRVEPARRVELAFFSACNRNYLAPRGDSDSAFCPTKIVGVDTRAVAESAIFVRVNRKAKSPPAIGGATSSIYLKNRAFYDLNLVCV